MLYTPLQVGLPRDKNTKFVVTTWVLSSSKCTKTRFRRWGSLRRSPDPLVGWGGGHPFPTLPPHSPPSRRRSLDAFGVSISPPSPSYKRNLRQCLSSHVGSGSDAHSLSGSAFTDATTSAGVTAENSHNTQPTGGRGERRWIRVSSGGTYSGDLIVEKTACPTRWYL